MLQPNVLIYDALTSTSENDSGRKTFINIIQKLRILGIPMLCKCLRIMLEIAQEKVAEEEYNCRELLKTYEGLYLTQYWRSLVN